MRHNLIPTKQYGKWFLLLVKTPSLFSLSRVVSWKVVSQQSEFAFFVRGLRSAHFFWRMKMSDFPFICIGKAIKAIVRWGWWVATMFAIVSSTFLLEPPFFYPDKALLLLIFGPVIIYIVGLFLYGFGMLVESAGKSKNSTTKHNSAVDTSKSNDKNDTRDDYWILFLVTITIFYVWAISRFIDILA